MIKVGKFTLGTNTLIFLFVLLLYFISALLLFNPQLFKGGDNIVYIILSKSIMKYHRYVNLHLVGSPAHVKYPFGYPLILGIWTLVSKSIVWMKLLSVFLGALGIWGINRLIKNNNLFFISVSLLIIFNPFFMVYTSRILSEIPFFAFFSLAMYFIAIWYKEDLKSYKFYLMIVFSIVPFYIRTIGIVIPVSLLLIYLKEREIKRLLIYLGSITLLISPWYIRNAFVASGGETYFKQFLMKDPYNSSLGIIGFKDLILRIKYNTLIYLKVLGELFFAQPNLLLGTLILIFIFIGAFKIMNENPIIALSILLYYLGIHMWPRVWSGDRFLIEILPFLFILFLYGFMALFSRLVYEKSYFYLFIVAISFIMLSSEYKNEFKHAQFIRKEIKTDKYAGFGDDWKNYIKAARWAKDHTKESDIFITRKPEFFYAFSGRQCVLYPFTSEKSKMEEFLNKYKDAYIVIDGFYWTGTTYRYLVPVILEHEKEYGVIFDLKGPPTYILKRIEK